MPVSSFGDQMALGLLAIGVFAIIVLINQHFTDSQKRRHDLRVARERNDAYRDVAQARHSNGDQEFDEKSSKLEIAELRLAIDRLNTAYQEKVAELSQLQERLATSNAKEIPVVPNEEKPLESSSELSHVGSLGEPGIDEIIEDDAPTIIFDEDEMHES